MSSVDAAFSQRLKHIVAAQNTLVKPNQRLENALSNSASNGLPAIAVNASAGQFLAILCQLVNAKSVLEIGTLGGYSSLCFADSVPGIQVTSVEINPKHRDVALENLKGQDNVNIILGSALAVLPTLEGRQEFDFVFIDADWDPQSQYFDWAVKLTRPGGCIFVDNAVRQITDGSYGSPGNTKLVDLVKNDERVNASLVSTLNTTRSTVDEGLVDGFLIAYVK